MPPLDERRRRAVSDAILRYFAEHPDAADSVTGIEQWWLPGEGVHVEAGELHAALDWLVEHGRVRRARLPDGTEVYSRVRSCLKVSGYRFP
jgi:hypothetical protein